MTNQEYVDMLKSSLLTSLKKIVMELIVKKLPFLGNFFFNPFVSLIVGKILTMAIESAEMGAFFLYTDMRVTQQGRAYEAAAVANKIAQQSGTPAQKKLAEENLIKCLRDLVRLGY